jgi:general secretion pathway protein K
VNARGFAQLLVLCALLLLGTLAMSFSFSMRTEALASRNGMDAVRAYYQARTGVERALALLAAGGADTLSREALTGGDDDAGYEVRIEPEGGKIDINAVEEETLKEILRNAGLSGDEAEALGDAILDWRDGDDTPRSAGAEAPYYAALPEPLRPRNGPFASVEELRHVRGVTPGIQSRLLSRIFTVYGRSPRVDVNAAPDEVLRALPGFSPEAAAKVAERREESPFRSTAQLSAYFAAEGLPLDSLSHLSTASLSRVYTLTATGRAGSGVVRTLRCTIDMSGGGAIRGKIIRWADHVPLDEEAR